MKGLFEVVEYLNSLLWGPPMLALLLGTGIWFTFRLRFVQVRKIKLVFKKTFGDVFKKSEKADEHGMSSFQALATAIAAQVGTGNLAGVGTAIAAGGPGAVFWMWLSGFFGAGTIFAEAILGQTYNQRVDGQKVGGPAYYIKHGLGSPALAGFFAVSIIIALGFIGNMVQSNSVSDSMNAAFGIPHIVLGIITAIVVGAIVMGGISRIASFAVTIVPIMAGIYILGCLVIIFRNLGEVIPAFQLIIQSAFNPMAATGGVVGVTVKEAMRYGIARGLFSNEAGMGSTPHSHAIAKVAHPSQQGFVAIMGVIIDTLVVCTFTALIIIITGTYETGLVGIQLTQQSFAIGLVGYGEYFIAISLFFFALSTIIAWYYFGEGNIKYLFGQKAIRAYQVIVLICIVLGTLVEVEDVWELADLFNGLMVIPNLIALLGLSAIVIKSLESYESSDLDK
ncbi:alanine/glycine:cation symporter family protein [Tindallia californiensis]|uniref:Alanine or glycine:cation symporter, AGCS family n=1 Tax=Tindallia californiensis TaxID=159292 RepID=A0A1H3QHQ3_9FIRM|nr:sodium:alanine symporter family protein [Tindallia californiensis]SDZ12525.1 alanine or glycine:cation symporter, AGCS family [Tindallia californiensis]